MNARKNIKIELTSKCFQGCFKCPRTLLMGQYDVLDLPIKHIRTIINNKPDRIVLMGNLGDPIYHSQFPEIVEMINRSSIPFSIYTVGSGYNEEWWRNIYTVSTNEDNRFVFDVDGLQDTAGTYRKGLSFDQSFTAMCVGASMGKSIRWSFPVLKHNQHQVEEACHLAKEFGIRLEINYSERWDTNDPWKPTISKKEVDNALLKCYTI